MKVSESDYNYVFDCFVCHHTIRVKLEPKNYWKDEVVRCSKCGSEFRIMPLLVKLSER